MAIIDNLVAYYSLDEASGNAIDAHGALDLTETSGTIDAASGKVGGARDIEAGDTERFVHADHADLSVGDIDFTFIGWVLFESLGGSRAVIAKQIAGAGTREYEIGYDSGANRLRFSVSPDGTAQTDVDAGNLGAPATATWYFIVAWHDAVNDQIAIQVNNGTPDTAAHSTGVINGTNSFFLGARSNNANPHDGLLDEIGLWKRVLTSDERTWLYNAGAGRSYADIVAGMVTAKPWLYRRHTHTVGAGFVRAA